MTGPDRALVTGLVLSIVGHASAGVSIAQERAQDQAAPLTVKLDTCKIIGPAQITQEPGLLGWLLQGVLKEELVKRGTVEVDGQRVTVFLPRRKLYSVKKTSPKKGMQKTSTPLYIDQNGGNTVDEDDRWFAHLPVRLGDRMFQVTEIASDGSYIRFLPSQAPLRRVIRGRLCPDFSFKTSDGKLWTRADLAGKTFLLDIWSVT